MPTGNNLWHFRGLDGPVIELFFYNQSTWK
jgi:hypothetical protein